MAALFPFYGVKIVLTYDGLVRNNRVGGAIQTAIKDVEAGGQIAFILRHALAMGRK